jgi:hypothetical protein
MKDSAEEYDWITPLLPHYVRRARFFGLLCLLVALGMAIDYGPNPLVDLGRSPIAKVVKGVVAFGSLIGFAWYGGMASYLWLLRRYGPRND